METATVMGADKLSAPEEGSVEEVLDLLLTEEELRQRMSNISRNYIAERREYAEAMKGYATRHAIAHLSAKVLETKYLKDPRAIEFVELLKTAKAPTDSDKEALVQLELEEQKDRVDAAKFACDTSDKAFEQFRAQSINYMAILKNNGPVISGSRHRPKADDEF
jgi:hypothetical protein